MDSRDVIKFWFEELSPTDWFRKSDATDALIARRFGDTHRAAMAGRLLSWRDNAFGALAEIIVLDQFSRNIFRGSPKAFAADSLALGLAREAVAKGYDRPLGTQQRSFLYMPFMHSEAKAVHEKAVELFSQSGLEEALKFELLHKEIIDRFGRYPHRNAILGRPSTKDELEFLKSSPGF